MKKRLISVLSLTLLVLTTNAAGWKMCVHTDDGKVVLYDVDHVKEVNFINSQDENFSHEIGPWSLSPRLPEPYKLDLSEKELSAFNHSNDFFNRLLALNIKENSNVMISPISLQFVLGMTMNGVNDDVMKTTKETLGFGELSLEEMNSLFQKVSNSLNSNLDTQSFYETQNSFWIDTEYENIVYEPFIQTIKEKYSSSTDYLPFTNPQSADVINRWCREATGGMIKEITSPNILAYISCLIVNACYFKADWTEPFLFSGQSKFHDKDGIVKQNDAYTMESRNLTHYAQTNRYQMARIPYGNGSFYMDVVLPAENVSTQELLSELDWNNFKFDNGKIDYNAKKGMIIIMPKFQAENQFHLNKDLQQLGLEKLLSASLSKIAGDLIVEDVLQSTKIEVNEKGTKAAAVSAVSGIGGAVDPIQYEYMVVDRPFLFAIREASSNIILFMGNVALAETVQTPIQ